MKITTLRLCALALLMLLAVIYRAEGAFGTWKMNSARSTFVGHPRPKALTARFEPHAKGEVFTLHKVGGNGQATTSSMILYLDGKGRELHSVSCTGTQSSRRVDERTVEILLDCGSEKWTRFVRRISSEPGELILDITNKLPDGRLFERHLILERLQEER